MAVGRSDMVGQQLGKSRRHGTCENEKNFSSQRDQIRMTGPEPRSPCHQNTRTRHFSLAEEGTAESGERRVIITADLFRDPC